MVERVVELGGLRHYEQLVTWKCPGDLATEHGGVLDQAERARERSEDAGVEERIVVRNRAQVAHVDAALVASHPRLKSGAFLPWYCNLVLRESRVRERHERQVEADGASQLPGVKV